MVKRMLDGFDLTPEALALDIIEQVGSGKHLTDLDHTLDRFRTDIWHPSLFDRNRFDSWRETGSPDAAQRAADCARELLREQGEDAVL
jgi:trimethylamine--corrinoid protein Co-methyltransferase